MIFNEGIYGDQNKKYEHDKMKLFKQVCLLQQFIDWRSLIADHFVIGEFLLYQVINDRSVLGEFIDEAYSYSFINSRCFAHLDPVKK